MSKKYLDLVRIIIGLIFILSSVGKIYSFNDFTFQIGNMFFLNDTYAIFSSSFLISLELIIGTFLLANIFSHESYIILILIISLIFIPFILYNYINNIDIDCGCFGGIKILETDNIIFNILKNILLLSAALMLLKIDRIKISNYVKLMLIIIMFFLPLFIYNHHHLHNNLTLVEKINVEQFFENPDNYIIIDARDKKIYHNDHIPNAISIPYLGKVTDLKMINELIRDNHKKKILTYCDAASCALAKLLALKISKDFKLPTYELIGGIEEWKKLNNIK